MHRGPNMLGVRDAEAPGVPRKDQQPGATQRTGERAAGNFVELREARKAKRGEVYRRRRLMAVALLVLGAVALVFAVFVQTRASDTARARGPHRPEQRGPRHGAGGGRRRRASPPPSVPRA